MAWRALVRYSDVMQCIVLVDTQCGVVVSWSCLGCVYECARSAAVHDIAASFNSLWLSTATQVVDEVIVYVRTMLGAIHCITDSVALLDMLASFTTYVTLTEQVDLFRFPLLLFQRSLSRSSGLFPFLLLFFSRTLSR